MDSSINVHRPATPPPGYPTAPRGVGGNVAHGLDIDGFCSAGNAARGREAAGGNYWAPRALNIDGTAGAANTASVPAATKYLYECAKLGLGMAGIMFGLVGDLRGQVHMRRQSCDSMDPAALARCHIERRYAGAQIGMTSAAAVVAFAGLIVGFGAVKDRIKAGKGSRALCALLTIGFMLINAALGAAPALAEDRKVCGLTAEGTARDRCNSMADAARDKIALASVGAAASLVGAFCGFKLNI